MTDTNMSGINPDFLEHFECLPPENIIAYLSYERYIASKFGSRNRLVCTFTSMVHHKLPAQNCFSRLGHTRAAYNHIGIAATYHYNFPISFHGMLKRGLVSSIVCAKIYKNVEKIATFFDFFEKYSGKKHYLWKMKKLTQ